MTEKEKQKLRQKLVRKHGDRKGSKLEFLSSREPETDAEAGQTSSSPKKSPSENAAATSDFFGRFAIKERKATERKEKKPRAAEFVGDKKLSQMEMQRRHTWFQKSREDVQSARIRTQITHEVRIPETFNGLYSARFSKDGDVIATTFGSGAIQVRNGQSGDLRVTLRSSLETSFPVMCCRFNPIQRDTFYASSACGSIFMCKVDTHEFTRFIEEPKNEVNTLDVSAGGEYLVTAGKDAGVRIYDSENGKLITIHKKNDADLVADRLNRFHHMRIFAAKFHQTYPELIITGGWDNSVRIWDIRVGSGSIRHFKGPHICGDAIDIWETNILTGSWIVRGSLQVWDLRNAKLIDTINPENRPTTLDGEFLYTVQYFDGDPYGDHVIVGGSGTGAVEVISLKEKKVMGKFLVNKAVVAVDSCQTKLVFGGMEALIRLADFI